MQNPRHKGCVWKRPRRRSLSASDGVFAAACARRRRCGRPRSAARPPSAAQVYQQPPTQQMQQESAVVHVFLLCCRAADNHFARSGHRRWQPGVWFYAQPLQMVGKLLATVFVSFVLPSARMFCTHVVFLSQCALASDRDANFVLPVCICVSSHEYKIDRSRTNKHFLYKYNHCDSLLTPSLLCRALGLNFHMVNNETRQDENALLKVNLSL